MQARLLKLWIIYDPGTVTVNYARLWFRRFFFGNLLAEGTPRAHGPVVENVDKTIQVIKVDLRASRQDRSYVKGGSQNDHLHYDWLQKKLNFWMSLQ